MSQITSSQLYCAHSNCVNSDSARQSQIEASRSDRRGPALSGQGEEEDQFGEVAASQNSHNLSGRSINRDLQRLREIQQEIKRLESEITHETTDPRIAQIIKKELDSPISLKCDEILSQEVSSQKKPSESEG